MTWGVGGARSGLVAAATLLSVLAYLVLELLLAGRVGPALDDGWIYLSFARGFLEHDAFSYPGSDGPAAAITAIGQAKADDNGAFWDADLVFHQVILRHCTKTVLVELWSSLNSRLTMIELLVHETFEASLRTSQEHHRAYLAELSTRDPERARRAAEEHYRHLIERMRRSRTQVKEVSEG